MTLTLMPLLLLACARPAPVDELVTTRVTTEVEGLRAELMTEGSAAGRTVGGDGADLILLYGGETGGELGPCGCDARPRGGLSRIATYRDAVRTASPSTPMLLVDTGAWLDPGRNLDGSSRLDGPERNGWMVRGMATLGPDAINIASPDMHGLQGVDASALPLVSANLQHDSVSTWRVAEFGDLRVGITGIAAPGPAWMAPQGWTVAEPAAAARAVIGAHRDEVDLVVLLANGATEAARDLAEEGLVDVVVDAHRHHGFTAPFRVDDAVWVRSHYQTMRLGELRLSLGQEDEATVATGWDRKIDLDTAITQDPDLAALSSAAEAAIIRNERALYGRRLR